MKDTGLNIPVSLRQEISCPHCNKKIDKVPLRIVESKSKLLIVEGADDEGFFKALLKDLGINNVQVAPIGGKTKTRPNLMAISKDPNFSKINAIGIIRDADEDPKGALQSVRDALSAAGLPSPMRPLNFVKGPPKVGIMIIPSLQQQGALEDLCLQAIANDPAMTCVAQYFDCIVQQGLNKPKGKELSKAKVRVFLSSREDPTLSLGIAAQKGYWPLDDNAFKTVRKFLQAL